MNKEKNITAEESEVMRKMGKRGGESTSEAKRASSKANALKARETLKKKRESLSTDATTQTT